MQNSDIKKLASIVALSLVMTFGISPVFAKSAAGGMTKSVIVIGEKSAAQSFGETIGQSDLIVLGEYKTEGKIEPGDYEKAEKLIADKPNWSSSWTIVQPLLKGINPADEGASLVQLLKQRPPLNSVVIDWIVYRLGDLRESRSADAILELFTNPSYSPQTISDALTRIAGAKLLAKLEAIATNSKSLYQGPAIEFLINCQHEKALPLLRNVLKTGGLDGKVRSLAGISRYGNCDDRKLLIPLADYWTGERNIHYWLMQALTEIQNRCNCK